MRACSLVGPGGDGQAHRELEAIAHGSAIRPSVNGSWSGGSVTSHGEEALAPSRKLVTASPSIATQGVSECPAYPLQPSPSLSSPGLGILYFDEGFPRGSMSRSMVNEWSSSNGNIRSGRSSKTKKNKAVAATTKKTVCPVLSKGGGEYEGLYGSDDDVDTTAWDLDSICSGISGEGSGEESPVAAPNVASGGQDGDGYLLDIDFTLDAIDNEADLSENCFGFGADADSDGSPDPGALEGQRKRNERLAGLLRMLSQSLESAANKPALDGASSSSSAANKKGDRCAGGARRSHNSLDVDEGSGGIHNDGLLLRTSRALGVLLRVMRRPRGPADASPPSITELPALLAARTVISLALDCCRGANSSTPAGTSRTDITRSEEQQQLLLGMGKACRHLFEVSKKAGADEAFFSSGAVAGLLGFVELAASSGLNLVTSGVGFSSTPTQEGQRARGLLRVGETGQAAPCGDDDDNDDDANLNLSSTSTRGSRGSRGSSTFDDDNDDDLSFYNGEHVQSICDSLTFAIGCLKNVSGDEGLQDRLVEAGSIQKLCRLVRSTRDLCRRCDDEEARKQRQASTQGSRQQLLVGDDPKDEECHLSVSLVDPSGEEKEEEEAGVGRRGGENGSDRGSSVLRDRVAPLLAQAVSLLRDLATGGKDRGKAFRDAGAVRTLCSILPSFRDYQDVLLNAARALAKLSLQEKTRADINSNPAHVRNLLAALVEQGREIDGCSYRDLEESCRDSSRSAAATRSPAAAVVGVVGPVERRRRRRHCYWEKQGKRVATCVRIAFALGNLTSASDDNRRLIGVRLGGADSLPALLLSSSGAHLAAWESLHYVENNHQTDFADRPVDGSSKNSSSNSNSSSGTRGGQSASFLEERWSKRTLRRACDGLEEMLVKTVRLLANISIHREVGQRVCRHPGLAALEPLVGTCLELFGLFEDGALPRADPCAQQGRRRSGAGPKEALVIPGEELLLNAVSLVTNLSFYGPDLEDSPVAPPADLAPPSTSIREGSSSSSSSRVAEPPTLATAAAPPHASTLFALASKARREVDEQSVEAAGSDTGDSPRSEGKVAGNVLRAASQCCRPADSPGETGGGRRREVLCGHLVKVLLHPNAEAVAEAARAFGNFSRDRSCREAMHQRRADEILVALLGHQSREVVFAAAGALVNVAADEACKALLSRESVGAGERLARLVRRAGLADPSLAELACQALHNLLIEPLPAGGVEQVLGGPDTYQRLWWTLKELMEACSCEGEGPGAENLRVGNAGAWAVGRQGGERGEPRELGGFPSAAAAVWGALNQGNMNCAPPHGLMYEEL